MLAYFGPNVLRFSVKQIFPLWGKIMKLAEIDQSGSIGQSSPGGTGIKVVSFRDMHSEISLKVSPINMWTSISAHLGPIFLSFICSSLNSFKILEHTKFMMILMLLKWMTKIHFLSKQTVFSLTLNQSYFRFHISNTDHIIDVVQGRLVKHFWLGSFEQPTSIAALQPQSTSSVHTSMSPKRPTRRNTSSTALGEVQFQNHCLHLCHLHNHRQ